MTPAKYPWKKSAIEGMLIVASVFLAISLESTWQERSDIAEARVALVRLLDELRADREFITLVVEEQELVGRLHTSLLNWFESPESLPTELVHQALRDLDMAGLTMWPRRAAWTTMVAAGQLKLLDDPNLVAHLGAHYEPRQQRLMYNAELYDKNKEYLDFQAATEIWDWQRKQLLTNDPALLAKFRNQILNLNSMNKWYLDFIGNYYGNDLNSLISEVEHYLSAHGNAIE